MTTVYNLTREDLAAFVKFHQRRWPHTNELSRMESIFLACICAFILLGLPVAMLYRNFKDGDTISSIMLSLGMLLIHLMVGALMTILALKLPKYRLSSQLRSDAKDEKFGASCELETDIYCIRETRSTGSTVQSWSSVQRVVMTPSHVFVYTAPNCAFVVPGRAFVNQADYESFANSVADRAGVSVLVKAS